MKREAQKRGAARWLLLVGLAVPIFTYTAWWLFDRNPGKNPSSGAPTFTVRRADLLISIQRKGGFIAEKSIQVRADIRGSAKIVWLVDEGTQVKKEQVLVELDKTAVENEITQLTSTVDKCKADLVASQVNSEITRLDSESKIRKATNQARMARSEIEKFQQGTQPKEVRDAQIRIEQAKVKLLRAKAVDDQIPDLFKQGFVTKEEVEQSKLDVQTAQYELGTAKLEEDILTKYTHPMKLRELESNRQEAEAEVERNRHDARGRAAQAAATLKQREQALALNEARLKDAKERFAKMTIRAEGDGIVVYGSAMGRRWRPDLEEIKVGATAHRQQVLMRLPNLETMQLMMDVHEADVNKIHVDEENPQPAIVTIESKPGQRFKGFVKKIDTLPKSVWHRPNVKWFPVTIGLKEQIPGVRPGTTAKVEIIVPKVKNVLFVPVQSIHSRNGRSFCYVIDGRPKPRRVTLGASSEHFVEVKEGLKEGDEVLLVNPDVGAGPPEEPKTPSLPTGRGGRREGR